MKIFFIKRVEVYNDNTMDDKQIFNYIIKIQSIAKIGLIYSKDPYAITNYTEINELSRQFLEDFMNVKFDRPNYFEKNIYPTPNISTRTIIFNEDRTKVLMVKEVTLQTYSLPGGWADLYDSPSTAAKNECRQEAGAEVEITRLVGIFDRTPHKESHVSEYVMVFEAKIIGDLHEHEYETDDVQFFPIDNLPEISKKTTKGELLRWINAALKGETLFD